VKVCRFQTLINEYASFPVTLSPVCNDFEEHAPTFWKSTHFQWKEYNGNWQKGNPHPNLGMIKSSLTTGLEATRANYGNQIRITSGYRCPHGNAAVDGKAQSFHMHGRAVDIYSVESENPWTEAEFLLLKAATVGTGFIETSDWLSYPEPEDHHFHVAW